jgi:hypothetical protein
MVDSEKLNIYNKNTKKAIQKLKVTSNRLTKDLSVIIKNRQDHVKLLTYRHNNNERE